MDCFRRHDVGGEALGSNAAYAGNVLLNPGFENGGLANWTAFGQGFNTLLQTGSTVARTGSNYFKIFQGFTGQRELQWAFIRTLPRNPEPRFTADGWAETTSGDKLAGANIAWLDLTFRDANSNTLALYRSAMITTNSITTGTFPVNAWNHLVVTNQYNPGTFLFSNTVTNLVAPAGTAFIRYEIFFQGDPVTTGGTVSGGSMYFDDLTLNQTQTNSTTPPPANTAWNIVWNDEFSGSTINPNHWQFETGNGGSNPGWGNNELEYYTSRTNNAYVSNGILHIMAKQESFSGFNYTSARMKTAGLFSKKYGRFEWRVRLPQGTGFWPALWMMPEDSVYGGWASSGEIDVMENNGSVLSTVLGTIHYGGAYPNQTQSSGPAYVLPTGDSVTNWHTYDLDWTNTSISWSVDGHLYETQTSWWSSSNPTNTNIRNPYPAPFDQPFYLIMNVAVGGNFLGNPSTATINANSTFPGDMQVDYIRVYDQTAPLQLSASRNNGQITLSWPGAIVCHLQVQTNLVGKLTTNWTDLSITTPPYALPMSPTNGSVFYRLASP